MANYFIGGSPRSGTTLLQVLLCQDRETNPPNAEATYLRLLVEAYHQAKLEFEKFADHFFDNRDDLRSFHSWIVTRFLERTFQRYGGVANLVHKDPHLSRCFPEVLELVPDARFLVIIRDTRDTIASLIRVADRVRAQKNAREPRKRNVLGLCKYYRSYYSPALNCEAPGFRERLFVLKYEDLVLHPKMVMEGLRAFTGLGLRFDPGAVPDTGDMDFVKRYGEFATQKFGGPIDSSSIGGYRKVLKEGEVDEVNVACRDFITKFRYC